MTQDAHGPVWVVTEGMAGTEKPALGLAAAIGCPQPIIKRIGLRQPWRTLSPWLGGEGPSAFTGDRLVPPWPRLVIASGRKSLAALRWIKKNHPHSVAVYIQKPSFLDAAIDLCVVPMHDSPPSHDPRIVPVLGTLSGVDDAYLCAAQAEWGGTLAALPRPLRAVLIGGPNDVYPMKTADLMRALEPLALLAGGFAVTVSRRSDPALKTHLHNLFPAERSLIWDGGSPNPYAGFLACADYIYVTPDSVSMACEAAGTGAPVALLDLPQLRASKFDRFHKSLIDHGAARWFDGSDKTWSYTPLREAERITPMIKNLLGA